MGGLLVKAFWISRLLAISSLYTYVVWGEMEGVGQREEEREEGKEREKEEEKERGRKRGREGEREREGGRDGRGHGTPVFLLMRALIP